VSGLDRPLAIADAAPTLGIPQWAHVVPAFDEWFGRTFATEGASGVGSGPVV
jgi:hypothetical protein